MAPTTSSQQFLAQAAQKLSSAIAEAGTTAPNEFAMNLVELLEVSTKINEFDEMASAANAETTSEEAQKWREISLMTMQHAKAHLVDQQQRLIEGLQGLTDSGASLYKAADAQQSSEKKPAPVVVQPPPGLSTEVKSDRIAVQLPPGLAAPQKTTKSAKPQPPPGLKPPPGLVSAGTASKVSAPPGFNAAQSKPASQKPKKEVAAHPWRVNKQGGDKSSNFFDARFGKETKKEANDCVINLDAYDSD